MTQQEPTENHRIVFEKKNLIIIFWPENAGKDYWLQILLPVSNQFLGGRGDFSIDQCHRVHSHCESAGTELTESIEVVLCRAVWWSSGDLLWSHSNTEVFDQHRHPERIVDHHRSAIEVSQASLTSQYLSTVG